MSAVNINHDQAIASIQYGPPIKKRLRSVGAIMLNILMKFNKTKLVFNEL